jgi:5'-nucleotidase
LKFLLTNDDGVEGPGLAALASAVDGLGTPTVVAPDRHLSGCSHQATTDRPLKLVGRSADCFHLDGTPADCTRIGLLHVVPEADWVLAGINEGGNLGADVYLSGTVAAVREAALLGRRAIAVSQYRRRGGAFEWEVASRWTRAVLDRLLGEPCSPGTFWNVNLPDPSHGPQVPSIVICPLDPHPLPVRFEVVDGHMHYRGVYQDRGRARGCDVDVCFGGQISVTALTLAGVVV